MARTNVRVQPYMFQRGFGRIILDAAMNKAFPGHGRNATPRSMDAFNDRYFKRMSATIIQVNSNLVCGVGGMGQ